MGKIGDKDERKKEKMQRRIQSQEKNCEIILHVHFTIQGRLDNRYL